MLMENLRTFLCSQGQCFERSKKHTCLRSGKQSCEWTSTIALQKTMQTPPCAKSAKGFFFALSGCFPEDVFLRRKSKETRPEARSVIPPVCQKIILQIASIPTTLKLAFSSRTSRWWKWLRLDPITWPWHRVVSRRPPPAEDRPRGRNQPSPSCRLDRVQDVSVLNLNCETRRIELGSRVTASITGSHRSGDVGDVTYWPLAGRTRISRPRLLASSSLWCEYQGELLWAFVPCLYDSLTHTLFFVFVARILSRKKIAQNTMILHSGLRRRNSGQLKNEQNFRPVLRRNFWDMDTSLVDEPSHGRDKKRCTPQWSSTRIVMRSWTTSQLRTETVRNKVQSQR